MMNPSLTYVRGSYGAFRVTVSATSIAQGYHALRCYFAEPLERLEAWDSERKEWALIIDNTLTLPVFPEVRVAV